MAIEGLRLPGLRGRVAIVTGASRGIGQAIALELARQEAVVVATATSPDGARTIDQTFAHAGLPGRGAVLDVRSDSAVAEFFAQVAAQEGVPLILVNNAGITRDNLLLRLKAHDWQELLDVNLTSAYRTSAACLRGMMKARWGRIVNIGSVVGASGNPGQTNYAAAKAGLVGFSKSLAREVGSRGITVNTVAPGFIDTDMTRKLAESQRDALRQQIPLDRLGDPQEIAAAVAFLASDVAAYITGETLHINGGMYMA